MPLHPLLALTASTIGNPRRPTCAGPIECSPAWTRKGKAARRQYDYERLPPPGSGESCSFETASLSAPRLPDPPPQSGVVPGAQPDRFEDHAIAAALCGRHNDTAALHPHDRRAEWPPTARFSPLFCSPPKNEGCGYRGWKTGGREFRDSC